MIVSRCLGFKIIFTPPIKNSLLKKENGVKLVTRIYHGSYFYRKVPKIDATKYKSIVVFGAFTWWWILWHLFTDYHAFIGHSLPDPSTYTDEELGIPED